MAFQVFTKDANQVVADANTSFTDKVVEVLGAPFSLSETQLVTKKNRAISIGVYALVVGGLAEAYGHYRARRGQQSFIPLMRG